MPTTKAQHPVRKRGGYMCLCIHGTCPLASVVFFARAFIEQKLMLVFFLLQIPNLEPGF